MVSEHFLLVGSQCEMKRIWSIQKVLTYKLHYVPRFILVLFHAILISSKNPQYMKVQCRKSCHSCVSLHHGDVPQIAPDEQSKLRVLQRLYETQEYLHREAEGNVEILHRCFNKHEECTYWFLRGECEINPGMTADCVRDRNRTER
jgi:hypothetical protein